MWFEVSFGISIAILTVSISYAVKHPPKWLASLTLGTYAMLFVMVFPFGFLNEPWGIVRNIFLSFVKTAQIFGLNSEFGAEVNQLNTPHWFAWMYSIWLSILYMVAPILTASFLLTFSRKTSNWLKWRFNRRKEVWVFSEPSEKSLLFAKSVLKATDDKKESVCVVFCTANGEYYERIVEIGAIAVMKNVDELDEEYFNRNRKPATLLFMSDDEERNLEQALSFVQKRKKDIEKTTLLYCFNSRLEAGLMLNAVVKQEEGQDKEDRIKLRRIAENRAVVYQELLQSGKEIARGKKQGEVLHILLVGCGWIGMEILKALLWCFVRYNLVIDVIDRKNIEKKFYRSCPGLLIEDQEGYQVNFIENEDIRTFDISQINNATGIDYVFVALGSDISNLECAVYLRQAFRRLNRQEKVCGILNSPEIHIVINNPGNRNLELMDHKNEQYDIRPFIQGKEYYTIQTLLNYNLEREAFMNHLAWKMYDVRDDKDRKRIIEDFLRESLYAINVENMNHSQWRSLIQRSIRLCSSKDDRQEDDIIQIDSFYKGDYESNSSRARAVFDLCGFNITGAENKDKQLQRADIEHKRWIRYMLTEGYQYGPIADHIAKLHPDIRKKPDERDLEYEDILERIGHMQ